MKNAGRVHPRGVLGIVCVLGIVYVLLFAASCTPEEFSPTEHPNWTTADEVAACRVHMLYMDTVASGLELTEAHADVYDALTTLQKHRAVELVDGDFPEDQACKRLLDALDNA